MSGISVITVFLSDELDCILVTTDLGMNEGYLSLPGLCDYGRIQQCFNLWPLVHTA